MPSHTYEKKTPRQFVTYASLNNIHWSEETDHLFHKRPRDVSCKHHTRLICRLIKEKLQHKIGSVTGDATRRHSSSQGRGGIWTDVLSSDPNPPNYYLWKFSPEYPSFPTNKVFSAWTLTQVRDCNNALETGALSVVDSRNPNGKKNSISPSTSKHLDSSNKVSRGQTLLARREKYLEAVRELNAHEYGIGQLFSERRLCINALQAALDYHILEKCGTMVYNAQDVLTGDGSTGLDGWRWHFPSKGDFTQFPERPVLWQWTTTDLKDALAAFDNGSFFLEPTTEIEDDEDDEDGMELEEEATLSRSEFSLEPQHTISNETHAITLGTPEPNSAEGQLLADQNQINHQEVIEDQEFIPDDFGLDAIVATLTSRANKWKEFGATIQRYKMREEDLRATNAEQAARIDELEKALNERASSTSEIGQDPMVKSGMDYILSELGRTKKINEDLRETIRVKDEEARNCEWLRDRNQILEMQLAEKTAEADSTREALNTLASSSNSRHGREAARNTGGHVDGIRRSSDNLFSNTRKSGGSLGGIASDGFGRTFDHDAMKRKTDDSIPEVLAKKRVRTSK